MQNLSERPTIKNLAGKRLSFEEAIEWARQEPSLADLIQICYYDDPIEAAAARFKASEEWPAITSFLPPKPGIRVLEIGAGRGIVSWAFASLGCRVFALEPNPSSLVGAGAIRKLCAATNQSIDVIETFGERLPFAACYFDYVFCRGVLHHVNDLTQVCHEVFRVLKPGGRFLAIKEHAADTPEELEAFLREHPLHYLTGNEHAFPLAVYKERIRRAGFRLLRDYGQFDHPISSAPALTTDAIRGMTERALNKVMPKSVATRLAGIDSVVRTYRRWMTLKSRAPGQLHTFLAEKHP
jgi:SAM-dependent methyltransferase